MLTLRVRMLSCVAGANFVYRPGKEYDVPHALAKRLIDTRQAVRVEELAIESAPETAARRVGKRRA